MHSNLVVNILTELDESFNVKVTVNLQPINKYSVSGELPFDVIELDIL
jgi:hypothetical protein